MKRLVLLLFSFLSLSLSAQTVAWQDTLQAAVKTDTRRIELSLGRLQTGLEGMRGVVSPLGEGDPIRWAHGLPGVTTGADGTTAMYVRGGGSGNNLFSLDGVPVYGYSHILGLTTIIPTQVTESAELGMGGFDGSEGNFTAAHLRIITGKPADHWTGNIALNNFLAGIGTEGPLGKDLSLMLSARVFPLSWEYRAFRGMLPGLLGGLDNFSAKVGDAYAKLRWEPDGRNTLEASFLGSLDRYGFDMPDHSHEMMGWNNMVGLLKWRLEGEKTDIEVTASANRYGSLQDQLKVYRETENHLSLHSDLEEYGLKAEFRHRLGMRERFTLDEGMNLRYALFAPGQVGGQTRRVNTLLGTAWLQSEYVVPDRISLKASARLNYYRNLTLIPAQGSGLAYQWQKGMHADQADPEVSVSAKWSFTPHLAFEATYDRMAQYYHTLEGLPVGWSLDMIVPSGNILAPEYARQGNVGLSGRFGPHSFSLGSFYKRMENLVYYKYAQTLFSGALAEWENYVETGNGRSFGLETLYEFQLQEWYARVSYTLSKTTRQDFPSFYDGHPFHARFDRRHVLNATAQWRGFTATLILQSGHWENGAAETYELPYLADSSWTADYYAGVNNYHMPTVFRLDLGWQKSFRTGHSEHTLNLGVCNVTNHFNPFMLYFDTSTESWKEIALLPILPNFSWRMIF